MISPVVRAYMELEKPRERVRMALARVDAAYRLHQQAFARCGPYPTHGWDRQSLAAREAALGAAVDNLRVVLAEASQSIRRPVSAQGEESSGMAARAAC